MNTVKSTIFKAPDLRTTTSQVAQLVPDGRAWVSKTIEGNLFHSLLKSGASAINNIQQQIEKLADEYGKDFIPEKKNKGFASRGGLAIVKKIWTDSSTSIEEAAVAVKEKYPDRELVRIEADIQRNIKWFKHNGFEFEIKFEDNKDKPTQYKIVKQPE